MLPVAESPRKVLLFTRGGGKEVNFLEIHSIISEENEYQPNREPEVRPLGGWVSVIAKARGILDCVQPSAIC